MNTEIILKHGEQVSGVKMSRLPNLLEYCKKCIERKQRFFTDDFEVLDYKNLEGEDKIVYKDKKEGIAYSCTICVFIQQLQVSFNSTG